MLSMQGGVTSGRIWLMQRATRRAMSSGLAPALVARKLLPVLLIAAHRLKPWDSARTATCCVFAHALARAPALCGEPLSRSLSTAKSAVGLLEGPDDSRFWFPTSPPLWRERELAATCYATLGKAM